jgi:hypothetical protein
MMRFLRAAPLMASLLLAACATDGTSSGVGMSNRDLASAEPLKEIGSGPLTPQSLLGVVPDALSARLGAPSFKRTEPQAEVWQYAGAACSLFIYFYKTDSGALASSYVDARKTLGGPADPASCLGEVVTQKSPPVS